MADYNINLALQNIWSVFRIVIDIAIMWFLFYYAIKAIRNNSRTVQIFKGIIAVVAVNGLAKLLGLSTLTYFTDIFINWGLLACIIIFQPEIRGLLEKIGKTNAFSRINSLLANEREHLVEQLYEATITLSKQKVGALITIEQSQSLQDYIKTARSKGLSEARITVKHQIRNAIMPVMTILGPTVASVLTGTFVIEAIFAIPGMGKYYVESVNNNDYSMILGMTVFYGIFLVTANLIVDILYGVADPRVRIGKK